MPSAWVKHVQSVYAKGKAGGMSYKQAMVKAKGTWKKGGKAAKASKKEEKDDEPEEEPEAAPKKKRRRKKKSP